MDQPDREASLDPQDPKDHVVKMEVLANLDPRDHKEHVVNVDHKANLDQVVGA